MKKSELRQMIREEISKTIFREDKKVTADVDYFQSGGYTSEVEKKYKVKIRKNGKGPNGHDITGYKKDVVKFLKSDAMGMDDDDVEFVLDN